MSHDLARGAFPAVSPSTKKVFPISVKLDIGPHDPIHGQGQGHVSHTGLILTNSVISLHMIPINRQFQFILELLSITVTCRELLSSTVFCCFLDSMLSFHSELHSQIYSLTYSTWSLIVKHNNHLLKELFAE